LVEYFTPKELEKKMGVPQGYWPSVILKELVDNALDAIEASIIKQVTIEYSKNGLCIFDSGEGLNLDNIKSIYNFDVFASNRRHKITPSRGKQGIGLKAVIGICFIEGYDILWHMNDGKIRKATIDPLSINRDQINMQLIEQGESIRHGVEIDGVSIRTGIIQTAVSKYAQCNPDVSFTISIDGNETVYPARSSAVNKISETSLSFYNFSDFSGLIGTENPSRTYKSVLKEYFGTRVMNASRIKAKIADLDDSTMRRDFEMLRAEQKTKPYTLLRKHLLGYVHTIETYFRVEDELFPCIIEFSIERIEPNSDEPQIICFINNSITYFEAESIVFDRYFYNITNPKKKVLAKDLLELLQDFPNYTFNFHFITPCPKFQDNGKTELDITDFIDELVDKLRKVLNKDKKQHSGSSEETKSQAIWANKYMTDAFMIASSNAKDPILARQMYYKLRELVMRENPTWETKGTYKRFTQDWLTQWLNENEQYEHLVYFADRGNFYADGTQTALGTANVRQYEYSVNTKDNMFHINGGLYSNVFIDDKDFSVEYKYDKVLYIEKTGYDHLLRAAKVDEKYNLIIVSGMGYSTRAVKNLLRFLQQKGLKIYCLHDLDIYGVQIFNSMQKANVKFKHDIVIEDLGITLEDVAQYNIVPDKEKPDNNKKSVEKFKAKKERIAKLEDRKLRQFFDKGDYIQRVEINHFTTQQILEIIDRKLGGYNNLPMINLCETLELDPTVLREAAFARVITSKYANMLNGIHIDVDLSEYEELMTLAKAKQQIPKITDDLLQLYEAEILQRLGFDPTT